MEVASSSLVGRSIWGSLAQLGEHLPYKQRVSGSSPLTSTKCGPVVQLVRTLACHARGRQFEPDPGRQFAAIAQQVERILGKDEVSSSNLLSSSSAEAHSARYALWVSSYRGIAQLVEQRSPKPRAEGSNPSTPAIHIRKKSLCCLSALIVADFAFFRQMRRRFSLKSRPLTSPCVPTGTWRLNRMSARTRSS